MYIAYTPQQQALAERLQSYMAQLMTDDLQAELAQTEAGGPEYHRALRQLGRDGWLGLGWPEAYGGQGLAPMEEFIFFDEVSRTGYPIPLLTLGTVGPTLMRYGSDAQKEAYLPRILAGDVHFSIGYTEPSSGTDLASLRTTAVRDGDVYVVQGQKVFTSLADHADYLWLAVRTDPEAPRHRGISILICPMDAPGVTSTPIPNLGDSSISTIYLEDVRVPVENLVGEENGGWGLITTQLNHERIALVSVGLLRRLTDEVRDWAETCPHGVGKTLLDEPWVGLSLGRLEARIEALKLLNWKQAWSMGQDDLQPADASAIKVYGSELYVDAYRTLMEILGAAGALRRGSRGAALEGRIERVYRAILVLTFGGGANEIQRDIIAQAGLRMPRGEGGRG